MMFPIAEVGFAEATWIMVVKSIVIFAVILGIVPMILLLERKLLVAAGALAVLLMRTLPATVVVPWATVGTGSEVELTTKTFSWPWAGAGASRASAASAKKAISEFLNLNISSLLLKLWWNGGRGGRASAGLLIAPRRVHGAEAGSLERRVKYF